MKKFCVILMLFCVFSFSGCSVDLKSSVANNISDVRYNIFVGKNTQLTASLMCGMRETPYSYDGISNKTCQFGIICVTFNNAGSFENLHYSLKIDKVETTGVLEENPYDHTYMTDIEKIVDNNQSVYLSIEGYAENLVLVCESEKWAIKYLDVLDIAYPIILENQNLFMQQNSFNAECYIKIITDISNESTPYYWYFGIVGKNGDNLSLIIDTQTGEIITKNIS